MLKLNLITLAFALTSTAVADFSGKGNIFVLKSDDSRTASLDKKAGCLDSAGKFVSNGAVCGVFTKNADPYNAVISSTAGPCTWADQSQEKNTDSIYGKGDNAFHCANGLTNSINDSFYTIAGTTLGDSLLCFGDTDCMFDAKKVAAGSDKQSVWQFHWGSQQLGITPGHVQLQWYWNKLA